MHAPPKMYDRGNDYITILLHVLAYNDKEIVAAIGLTIFPYFRIPTRTEFTLLQCTQTTQED